MGNFFQSEPLIARDDTVRPKPAPATPRRMTLIERLDRLARDQRDAEAERRTRPLPIESNRS